MWVCNHQAHTWHHVTITSYGIFYMHLIISAVRQLLLCHRLIQSVWSGCWCEVITLERREGFNTGRWWQIKKMRIMNRHAEINNNTEWRQQITEKWWEKAGFKRRRGEGVEDGMNSRRLTVITEKHDKIWCKVLQQRSPESPRLKRHASTRHHAHTTKTQQTDKVPTQEQMAQATSTDLQSFVLSSYYGRALCQWRHYWVAMGTSVVLI